MFSTRFCPTASFHMKIDDDVVIHLDRMFHFLVDSTSTRDALMCKIWTRARPVRRPENKWFDLLLFHERVQLRFVSREDWPGDKFPRYCNGPMYLMGIPAVRKILEVVPTLEMLKLEVGVTKCHTDYCSSRTCFSQELQPKKQVFSICFGASTFAIETRSFLSSYFCILDFRSCGGVKASVIGTRSLFSFLCIPSMTAIQCRGDMTL